MKCTRCGLDYPSKYYFEETPEGLLCLKCAKSAGSPGDGTASGRAKVKRIRQVVAYSGGREGLMIGLAVFFLVIGLLGLTTVVVFWAVAGSAALVPLGIVLLINGIALYIVLQGGAEIIRLLKKLNGLPYGGEISSVEPIGGYVCSACGARVWELSSHCPGCSAEIED